MFSILAQGWKIHMIASYLQLMTVLTNGIQVLQHWWKMDYVEILTSFSHIPWEHLGLPMNFSAKPCTLVLTYRECKNVKTAQEIQRVWREEWNQKRLDFTNAYFINKRESCSKWPVFIQEKEKNIKKRLIS